MRHPQLLLFMAVFLWLQDHFEQSQFEEIARSSAGGKKLKPNAIPTLFSFGEPPYPAVTSPYILLPMKSEAGLEPSLPSITLGRVLGLSQRFKPSRPHRLPQ